MKRIVTLSMLIACAAICSCQKHDSATEQQLTRPKAELDGREQAFAERVSGLEERMNELDKRVSALAEREIKNAETTPSAAQSHVVVRDPAQAQAEVDSEIQQTPTDAQAMGPSNVDLEKDREQQRLAQARRGLDKESNRRRKLEQTQKWMMSQATPSPAVDATSSNSSPTPP